MYSMYFYNFTTGEIVYKYQYGKTAHHAYRNFRRLLRERYSLSKGERYNILQYAGERSSLDWPEMLFDEAKSSIA